MRINKNNLSNWSSSLLNFFKVNRDCKNKLLRKKGVLAAKPISAYEHIGNLLKEGALLHLQGKALRGLVFQQTVRGVNAPYSLKQNNLSLYSHNSLGLSDL